MTRHATDIAGYTFKADHYCPSCVLPEVVAVLASINLAAYERVIATPPDKVETALDGLALIGGFNRYDERTFDSDEFPKVVFVSQLEDDRCGSCGEVL